MLVRNLRPKDLERVVDVDTRNTGRSRAQYFKIKLAQALADTGIQASLPAEFDGVFAGFLLARVYYGEFGRTEPAAVLDTLAVHPDFRGRHVGAALLAQLKRNLAGLRVGSIQTDVAWEDQGLLAFFQHEGFRPAARFALDLPLGDG